MLRHRDLTTKLFPCTFTISQNTLYGQTIKPILILLLRYTATLLLTSLLNKYISSKHVGQRSIVVKVIKSLDEAAGCSILFVPSDQSSKIKQLSEQLKGKPVLIISEKYGQSKKGASISIFLDEDDDDKTKFEICKTLIVSNGLIISSNLLKLASQVN